MKLSLYLVAITAIGCSLGLLPLPLEGVIFLSLSFGILTGFIWEIWLKD